MKKRGFTLVELLGVIVALGILALITTPIVMNLIDESNKNSALRSAEQIIKSATLDYTVNDSFSTEKKDVLTLSFNGKRPDEGYIQFDENEKVRFYMVQNGYCVAKRYDTELQIFKMDEVGICDWNASSNTIRQETTDSILTLNDLKEGNLLNYKIYGNSYQATRIGKNLLNINRAEAQVNWPSANNTDTRDFEVNKLYKGLTANNYYINSYVSYRIDGDSIFVSSKSNGYGVGFPIKVKGNTTYTISGAGENNIIGIGQYDTGGNFVVDNNLREISVNSKTFTTKENTEIITVVLRPVIGVGEVEYKNIQIEEGTTATEYESYGVMPSPEYPSEIQSLGKLVTEEGPNKGKYEIPIKVTGKNLFDLDSAIITGADVNDNKITANKDESKVDIYLKKGTYSIKIDSNFSSNIFLRKGQVNKGFFESMTGGNVKSFTFSEDGYLRISHFTAGNTISNIMIMNGSYTAETMPEYEPYKEENYSIYLDEPLRCVGDVCDELNFETGQVTRKINQLAFTGTETFPRWINSITDYSIGLNFRSEEILGVYGNPKFNNNALSTHFTVTNRGLTTPDDSLIGKMYISPLSNPPYFGFKVPFTTVDAWKNYLNEQYSNGTPVTINYELIESEYKHQSVTLPQIKMFEDTNNIIVTDGNLYASKIEVVATKK